MRSIEHVCFVLQPAKQAANLFDGAVHDEQGQADGAGLGSHRIEAVQESSPCAHWQVLLVDIWVRLHRLDHLQQRQDAVCICATVISLTSGSAPRP